MRSLVVSLAGAVSLLAAAPVAGKESGAALDPEKALDCGTAYAVIAAMLEESAPRSAAEMLDSANVWLYLAYERLGIGEEAFDARAERRAEDFYYYEFDEFEDTITRVTNVCTSLQAAHSDIYAAASAAIQAEK